MSGQDYNAFEELGFSLSLSFSWRKRFKTHHLPQVPIHFLSPFGLRHCPCLLCLFKLCPGMGKGFKWAEQGSHPGPTPSSSVPRAHRPVRVLQFPYLSMTECLPAFLVWDWKQKYVLCHPFPYSKHEHTPTCLLTCHLLLSMIRSEKDGQ